MHTALHIPVRLCSNRFTLFVTICNRSAREYAFTLHSEWPFMLHVIFDMIYIYHARDRRMIFTISVTDYTYPCMHFRRRLHNLPAQPKSPRKRLSVGSEIMGTPFSRSPWWGHQMETFSAFLALYEGNSPVTGEFPSQRPVTQSFSSLSAWTNG